VAGSTQKIQQIVGDQDYQTKAPTTNKTVTRYNILGSDVASSFENNGKLMFLFGDTISGNTVNFRAHDPIASSTVTNPEAGLLLNYYTNSDGSPLFVEPPGVNMGADNVPNAGITLADGIYLVCNTGADTSAPDPHADSFSVLVRFDEKAQTFTAGRTISRAPGGHFIITSLRTFGTNVFMFGVGSYRASDVYLAMTPASTFASGAGTQYFAGYDSTGAPKWTNSESGAVPAVQDNPLNGPAWPNDNPSVGNLSVVYSSALNLWLMTYDGGRQSAATRGVYFSYAQQPWGPWATPQLIFSPTRDNALGAYIHNPAIVPNPPGDGLNGPTIGPNDIYSTAGAAYAPLLIERFVTVVGSTLNIYYTLSTWNPYTVIEMRSSFTIAPASLIGAGGIVNNASYNLAGSAIAPGSIAAIFGTNLTDGTSCLQPACNPVFGSDRRLNTALAGSQVMVNGKPAPILYASPTQVGVQIPYEITGTSATIGVSVAGRASTPATVEISPAAPGIFAVSSDGKGAGAITHANGTPVTTQNPARPGEIVIIYATGLGQVAPSVPTGAVPSGTSNTVAPVSLSIGGISAIPDFAGVAGCCVGLNQINARIPNGISPGNAVPVIVTIGGKSSNTATIAVQ
jgi:uncharacterized protein (TIGR03437 family)